MTFELAWLWEQYVPLWAFLLAVLTAPAMWSDRLQSRLSPLLDRLLPGKK